MTPDDPEPRANRLIDSIRSLGATLVAVAQTRLEILALDLTEERFNAVRTAMVCLGILFCFQSGVLLAVLFFVLSVAEANRLAAIGVASLVLLLVALGGALWLWRWLKARPPLFTGTVAELRKDHERLRERK